MAHKTRKSYLCLVEYYRIMIALKRRYELLDKGRPISNINFSYRFSKKSKQFKLKFKKLTKFFVALQRLRKLAYK